MNKLQKIVTSVSLLSLGLCVGRSNGQVIKHDPPVKYGDCEYFKIARMAVHNNYPEYPYMRKMVAKSAGEYMDVYFAPKGLPGGEPHVLISKDTCNVVTVFRTQ